MNDAQRIKFGQMVKATRKKVGMTQEELANNAAVKVTTLKKIEKGSFNVSLDLINRLAAVMGGEVTITIQ